MEKLVPIFYTEYGRYVSRFRSIPLCYDCLIPVHRRLLLSLFEVAPSRFVKCAKIIGHAVGNYHPHGSDAAYEALVNLWKVGCFINEQGNFGSKGLIDAEASAYRYTEAKLKKWVPEFCFDNIKYVPWENFEYNEEPVFLPAPLPMGLIGKGGVYSGIAFHHCVFPKYKINDLAKRLKYLLTRDEKDNVLIYPNFEADNCDVEEDKTECLNILQNGAGTLTIYPKAEIKGKSLHIYGKPPAPPQRIKYTSLVKDVNIHVKDITEKDKLEIQITPVRKINNYEQFFADIYTKHIETKISYKLFTCDLDGKVTLRGVDELLLLNYEKYVETIKYHKIDACLTEIKNKFENQIILIIRKILKNNPNVKRVDEIVQIYQGSTQSIIDVDEYDFTKDCWVIKKTKITDQKIRSVCGKRNIRALIEYDLDITENDTNINLIKNSLINNNNECYDYICNLTEFDEKKYWV